MAPDHSEGASPPTPTPHDGPATLDGHSAPPTPPAKDGGSQGAHALAASATDEAAAASVPPVAPVEGSPDELDEVPLAVPAAAAVAIASSGEEEERSTASAGTAAAPLPPSLLAGVDETAAHAPLATASFGDEEDRVKQQQQQPEVSLVDDQSKAAAPAEGQALPPLPLSTTVTSPSTPPAVPPHDKPSLPSPHSRTQSRSSMMAPPLPSASATSLHRSVSSQSSSVGGTGAYPNHSRAGSLGTLPATTLSTIHLLSALETMAKHRDARRSQPLQKALATALEVLKSAANANASSTEDAPRLDQSVILEPLRLACETRSAALQTTALDCISKLVSHSFFVLDDGSAPELAERLTAIITATYTESTPDAVALQVVKSLLALILSPGLPVHHSALLRAVRTVYNIFLLSSDPTNQMVAQAGLTQMVHHVFSRIDVAASARNHHHQHPTAPPTPGPPPSSNTSGGGRTRAGSIAASSSAVSGKSGDDDDEEQEEQGAGGQRTPTTAPDTPAGLGISNALPPTADGETAGGEAAASKPASLSTFNLPNPNDAQAGPGDDLDIDGPAPAGSSVSQAVDANAVPLTEQELFVKDAFLVFRALCKLTMKPLMTESDRELRSHAMRSKLLSLHLILTILQAHIVLFAARHITIPSSTPGTPRSTFVQATKQYLCLSLSRNAVSPVGQVFELSVEIFWNVMHGLRGRMKKEIEVLLNEIFLPILEMRTSTLRQKSLVLGVCLRLARDPQALVEIYLNYDCDRTALANIYERLVEVVAKLGATQFAPTAGGIGGASANAAGSEAGGVGRNEGGRGGPLDKGPIIPPSLTTSAMGGHSASDSIGGGAGAGGALFPGGHPSWASLPPEVQLKRQGLECLVTILRSLVQWGTAAPRGAASAAAGSDQPRPSEDSGAETLIPEPTTPALNVSNGNTNDDDDDELGVAASDDPERFETAKLRKTTLLEGIKKFNFKPKDGIKFLLEHGFVRSVEPTDIAKFLLATDGLSKAAIGEYLGEGDAANVATMHAFVDLLDFRNLRFTDAVRTYLQAFRLPGEAQKIDRFVLKFAERYIAGNPRTEFANADTAYILAFSVIMLNTDAHNKNMKQAKMTKAEFVKNNRGINDGRDLPEQFLGEVYDEIQENEIKMKDEIEVPQVAPVASGLAGTIANVGRDRQREAYVLQSEGMTTRSEALFKTMLRQQRRAGGARGSEEMYYSASHLEHVRPMFEVAWMAFLAALSAPLQETDELEVVELCLEGFKHAIKIVCLFDLGLERNAFVSTLSKFTFLNNLSEMKPKNVEAIKTLLEIAVSEGNYLKGSWRDVLTCVSQLERMQLISNGIETPDIGRRSSVASKKAATNGRPGARRGPGEDVASESRSAQVTVAADMVFSLSKHLSGSAIVEFVQALSDVSWEEIQSSSRSDHPRLFSLQKLVEISYYNMGRIRLEWSNIWSILGEHFNQVCCHNNANVSFFALDALRQLAMRFLEKDELSHFQFQKDFLKPFEHTMIHNTNSDARDMVLQCLQQMIQARVGNMRSGWRTMFGVFSAASRVLTERVATYAFELVTLINQQHFAHVVRYGAFADLTVCLTDFCKVSKYQKISLQAIEMLRGVVPAMLACPDCSLNEERHPGVAAAAAQAVAEGETSTVDDPMVRFWFPVLFSFYDVIMNGDDLEVRRVALDSLFETLKTHGASFRPDFWDTVCQEVLFPIFAPLRSGPMQEEMSFWVSTTMVTALRNLVDLYTFYFEILERFLDPLLDLLCYCIDQENDTLARIGTTCFQQLLESNVRKLSPAKWERIVSAFIQLFQTTLAHMLFDENLRSENELPDAPAYSNDPAQVAVTAAATNGNRTNGSHGGPLGISAADRRRVFRQIIRKCVLQLLLIETTHELLLNDEVHQTIPAEHLLRFLGVLDDSYQFARRFNADKELRVALWKVGFMKQLPNLLKQESSSAATLVSNLLRMYADPREDHRATQKGVLVKFVPLSLDILRDFNALDSETQLRHISAWSPVVAQILHGYVSFEAETFETHLDAVYPLATDLLLRETSPDVREGLRRMLVRVGEVKGLMAAPRP